MKVVAPFTGADPQALSSLVATDGWNTIVSQTMAHRQQTRPEAVRHLCEGVVLLKGPGSSRLKASRPALLAARVLRKISSPAAFVPLFKDLLSTFRESGFPMNASKVDLPTLGTVWLAAWMNGNHSACAALDRLNPAWPDDMLALAGSGHEAPGRLIEEALVTMKALAPLSDPWGIRVPLARCMGRLLPLWDWVNWDNRSERLAAWHRAVRAGCVIAPTGDPGPSHPLVRFWEAAGTPDQQLLRCLDTLAFAREVSVSPDLIMQKVMAWVQAGATVPESDFLVDLRQEGLASHHPEVLAAVRAGHAPALPSGGQPGRSRCRP